jgi:SAM-dependent methyltransferase
MTLDRQVAAHYTRDDLEAAVLGALQAAGKDLDRLTIDDLAPIDEFHVRGREATMEMGQRLGLSPAFHVLDVGSGVGGPSRRLADAFGCRITGIDLTPEFCRVATMLATRVGLDGKVAYREGNALAMPFEDASFDAAYTQHVAMNIEDKAGLYAEIARVLKPGAAFGIYDLLQGEGGEPMFPVPWARTPETSFLASATQMRSLLADAGFEIVSAYDSTEEGRAWFVAMQKRAAEGGPSPLSAHVLLGPDFPEMVASQVRNLIEGRIAPTEFICRKR